jgi:cytochrome c5
MTKTTSKSWALVTGAAAVLVAVGGAVLMLSGPAAANPQFAAETGKTCTDCHTTPEGGAALTPFGQKFKDNGNKLPK